MTKLEGSVNDIQDPLMIGIQGPPGTGKTWSALTFPNPVVVNLDRGLTCKHGTNVQQFPFYDSSYCVQTHKMSVNSDKSVNKRDGVKKWLKENAPKLDKDQTLILDSWTTLQNYFDIQTKLEPVYTRQGNIDDFAPWKFKIEYSSDILTTLQSLKCMVVVIFHEKPVRDEKTGLLTDKIEPLMSGQFVNQLKIPFSDFFRQRAIPKIGRDNKPILIDGKELPEEMNYLWQIKSDVNFDAKTRMTLKETYIKATYQSLKY